jgi:hypothetical protein
MQGYSTGSLGSLITVQYIGYIEASRQGYSTGSLGPLIIVHYIGYIERSLGKVIVLGVWGH